MTDSIKQQFEVYSNALGIRNKRNEILASNIATLLLLIIKPEMLILKLNSQEH